jgi:hypothetical protein
MRIPYVADDCGKLVNRKGFTINVPDKDSERARDRIGNSSDRGRGLLKIGEEWQKIISNPGWKKRTQRLTEVQAELSHPGVECRFVNGSDGLSLETK